MLAVKDEQSEERSYIERTRSLRALYLEKVKALDRILGLLDKKERKPLSGVSPVKAAIDYLKANKGKHSYYEVVKHLLAEGCCGDTEYPSRSISQGLSKGIRDGSLMAEKEGEKFTTIWLP